MGTRGAWGFRSNGEDKVTYNNYDSYPDGLGINVLHFCQNNTVKELREVVDGIVLVSEDGTPDDEAIEKYTKMGLFDGNVGNGNLKDWYCLLREVQYEPGYYVKGCQHMLDSHEFLGDSLFCEWAYIINLDSGKLEVYRGFNRSNVGRYDGVGLVKEFELDSLCDIDDEQFCSAFIE